MYIFVHSEVGENTIFRLKLRFLFLYNREQHSLDTSSTLILQSDVVVDTHTILYSVEY